MNQCHSHIEIEKIIFKKNEIQSVEVFMIFRSFFHFIDSRVDSG